MCLIVLAYKVHPRYPFLLAANRDEFRARPTDPLGYWADAPAILAGRDRQAGGTWLGLHTSGRFAALTNYRDLRRPPVQGPSRGLLVRQVLEDPTPPKDTARYEGFNLIYGPLDALRYHNNIVPEDVPLTSGVHGLSNALLNTPWRKVEAAREGMLRILHGTYDPVPALFRLMAGTAVAADAQLPDTGLGLARERALSPMFIDTEAYGTRCTTVVSMDAQGHGTVEERSWPQGSRVEVSF